MTTLEMQHQWPSDHPCNREFIKKLYPRRRVDRNIKCFYAEISNGKKYEGKTLLEKFGGCDCLPFEIIPKNNSWEAYLVELPLPGRVLEKYCRCQCESWRIK